jgi:hypothetical protein
MNETICTIRIDLPPATIIAIDAMMMRMPGGRRVSE